MKQVYLEERTLANITYDGVRKGCSRDKNEIEIPTVRGISLLANSENFQDSLCEIGNFKDLEVLTFKYGNFEGVDFKPVIKQSNIRTVVFTEPSVNSPRAIDNIVDALAQMPKLERVLGLPDIIISRINTLRLGKKN